jgi:hypothetical protein
MQLLQGQTTQVAWSTLCMGFITSGSKLVSFSKPYVLLLLLLCEHVRGFTVYDVNISACIACPSYSTDYGLNMYDSLKALIRELIMLHLELLYWHFAILMCICGISISFYIPFWNFCLFAISRISIILSKIIKRALLSLILSCSPRPCPTTH